jgi:hypothetical protein
MVLTDFHRMNGTPKTSVQEFMDHGVDVFIQRRTTRVVDADDVTNAGTGVLIRLRDHFFVATASHVIQRDHNYYIAPSDPNANEYSDFVAKHLSCIDDVAVLELNPRTIERFLAHSDYQFLERAELFGGRYPNSKAQIQVVGYPGHEPMQAVTHVDVTSKGRVHWVGSKSLSYVTGTLSRREWPSPAALSRKVRRGRDVFCSFDPTIENVAERDLREMPGSIATHKLASLPMTGMSGGGIWLARDLRGKNGLIVPGADLVGIQVSYAKDGRGKWLRGTRTKALIDLIEANYPGLLK